MTAAQHQQLGSFSPDGNVVRSGTPGANNVNLLVEMVLLNYMALHGEQGHVRDHCSRTTVSGATRNIDRLTAFAPIV